MDASGVVRTDRIEASQLKGSHVYGADGGLIGTIQDLVVSVADGRIIEVIVWFGKDALGEASYYGAPWHALTPAGDDRGYVVDRSAATPMEIPGVSRGLTSDAVPRDAAAEPE